MDSVVAALLVKALDGLSARAVVTAENLANAGTPNYRPLRLTFEEVLQQAAGRGEAAIRNVEPRLERTAAGTPEAELRPDLELATQSSTALRYGALIEVLNRQMQLEAVAVTGSN